MISKKKGIRVSQNELTAIFGMRFVSGQSVVRFNGNFSRRNGTRRDDVTGTDRVYCVRVAWILNSQEGSDLIDLKAISSYSKGQRSLKGITEVWSRWACCPNIYFFFTHLPTVCPQKILLKMVFMEVWQIIMQTDE